MISNSTPIICLAKTGRLQLLRKLFGSITVTEVVNEEVMMEGKPGFAVIFEAFREGWLKTLEAKGDLKLGLGKGEESVIILAKETGDSLILDDAFAIRAAKALGINHIRTTTAITAAVGKKILTRKEAVTAIKDIVSAGYYITPSQLAALLTRLNG